VVRLSVETLEGRALMSAVTPVPPPGQVPVAFAPPTGSNHGNFASDGQWISLLTGASSRPSVAPLNGICAVWHS
jgi:hypothetical protein